MAKKVFKLNWEKGEVTTGKLWKGTRPILKEKGACLLAVKPIRELNAHVHVHIYTYFNTKK